MSNPQQPYQLELWFIAPFDAKDFRMHCLRFFTESEKARVHPFHQWRDIHDDYFNDTLMLEPPRALSNQGPRKTMLRLSAPARREKQAKPTVPGGRRVDTAQDTVPDVVRG